MGIVIVGLLFVAAFVFIFYWLLYSRDVIMPATITRKVLFGALIFYPFICAFAVMMINNLLHEAIAYPGILFFFFHFLLATFSVVLTIRLFKIHKWFIVPIVLNTLAGVLYFGGILGGVI